MHYLVRTALAVAGASLLVGSRFQAPADGVEVVILNGPNAGTYRSLSSETVCAHFKAQKFSTATWRDTDIKDPKKLSAAGIKVDNPEVPGPKKGDVLVAFGEGTDKGGAGFRVLQQPVTMTVKGKGAVFVFEGTIKGVKAKVTGTCKVVEEL
jgi:hypothetical protein